MRNNHLKRPVPDTFADDARVMTRLQLRLKYVAGYSTIDRWVAEVGQVVRPRLKPVPADLTAEVAAVLSTEVIAQRYDVHVTVARRWVQELGLNKCQRFDLPANIAEIMAENTVRSGAKVLGVHEGTLRRLLRRDRPDLHKLALRNAAVMLAERNAAMKRVAHDVLRQEPAKPRKLMPRAPSGQRQPVPCQSTPKTRADMAMRWLQRFGPCYPMSVHLKALDDYMILGRRMSAAAVIAEAERRGWQPDAWRQVAA